MKKEIDWGKVIHRSTEVWDTYEYNRLNGTEISFGDGDKDEGFRKYMIKLRKQNILDYALCFDYGDNRIELGKSLDRYYHKLCNQFETYEVLINNGKEVIEIKANNKRDTKKKVKESLKDEELIINEVRVRK